MIIKASDPKSKQVADVLRKRILQGQIPSGTKLQSVRNLADSFQVGKQVIQSAIKTLENEEMLITKLRKGIYVNTEIPSDQRTIGVIAPPEILLEIPPLNLFNFSDICSGITQATTKTGCAIVNIPRDKDCNSPNSIVKTIENRSLCGIISVGGYNNPDDWEFGKKLAAKMKKIKIPFVIISSAVQADVEAHYITSEEENGSFLAVKHLIDSGHRKIGCVMSSYEGKGSFQRLKGYRQALEESGIGFDERLIIWCRAPQDAETEIEKILPLQPSALFTTSDIRAYHSVKALKAKGFKIPDDISVISVDDMESASFFDPPLSTVRTPRKEMGVAAVELIHELLNGKIKNYVHRKLETKLIIRDSCKKLN